MKKKDGYRKRVLFFVVLVFVAWLGYWLLSFLQPEVWQNKFDNEPQNVKQQSTLPKP